MKRLLLVSVLFSAVGFAEIGAPTTTNTYPAQNPSGVQDTQPALPQTETQQPQRDQYDARTRVDVKRDERGNVVQEKRQTTQQQKQAE